MKKNNEIKDEKLEKVSGGYYLFLDKTTDETANGNEEQKFINIDGAIKY